jgi:hypothetical protein
MRRHPLWIRDGVTDYGDRNAGQSTKLISILTDQGYLSSCHTFTDAQHNLWRRITADDTNDAFDGGIRHIRGMFVTLRSPHLRLRPIRVVFLCLVRWLFLSSTAGASEHSKCD